MVGFRLGTAQGIFAAYPEVDPKLPLRLGRSRCARSAATCDGKVRCVIRQPVRRGWLDVHSATNRRVCRQPAGPFCSERSYPRESSTGLTTSKLSPRMLG